MDIASSSIIATFLQWPIDWPLFGLAASLFALESYSFGSTRSSSVAIAFPLAFLAMLWLPTAFLFNMVMPQLIEPVPQSALFALVFIGFYFLVHRVIFAYGSGSSDILRSLISGVATAIIIIVFWIQTPGLRDLWQFGPQIQMVFGESLRVWWLTGVFAALAYTRG